MPPLLTVFTPTYNRGYILEQCYESLTRQTCQDFIWLIVDDGSTDHTQALVRKWQAEQRVLIRYVYQENQGMHGAHNTAYALMDTELNVCIDSDDYMPEDAVEKIIAIWRSCGDKQVAGIVGLDATFSGEIIGTKMPEHIRAATLTELYETYKIKGDKKLVYRSALTRATPPYPIYPGETYCPLNYKYILIDQQYPLLIYNDVLCHVEYREDGSSKNMIHQYRRNPRGFTFYRKVAMQYAPSFKKCLRESIHYVSSSLMLKNWRFLLESPKKLSTLCALPFGIALYVYVQGTKRATIMKGS
ncbi:beta-glycosyltransferase [Pullulanibacillus camelliae]|uniref:Beta-glycosyltransferase n=1 Tax=Pullulanibacillus camelliae TaxID=1707096 RepID=A0A8J2YF32_9BACL|nr:glycosyltransferase family A protein [Pullulanibacillus camelliae]GGE30461.1 beta-glycosyltransferase [Pullulanibacillus camelliae]